MLHGCDLFSNVDSLSLLSTVRPENEEPITKEGLYVFRFFEIYNKDVERIAELSKDAWTSFEVSNDYQAEPQALFCLEDRTAEIGKMLLVTWYDGLNSWQISRRPPENAAEKFRQRHEMTLSAKPFATRLFTS